MLDRGSQPWEGLGKKPLRMSNMSVGTEPIQQRLMDL